MTILYPRPASITHSPLRIASLLVALSMLALLGSAGQPRPLLPDWAPPSLGGTPLSFTPNAGQSDPAVLFQAGALSGTIFFTAQEVLLSPPDGGAPVRVRFEGASPRPRVRGEAEQPGAVNFFVGEPARWRANLPAYAGVVYEGLYPGVDLRYDGVEGALKGTYTVAPGANPAQIRWRYPGAERVAVSPAGDLLIALGGGRTLTEQAPVAWQEVGGGRAPVDAAFRLDGGAVGFALGAYDAALPLIVDPYLIYSSFVGGGGGDEGRDIAVDAQGNVYVTGSTLSANFPSARAPQASYGGPADGNFGDAFVMKLNPAGNALIYMTYLGGAAEDVGDAIAVDADGNAYVTGMTRSNNFPRQAALQSARGGDDCTSPPCADAFVTKLNPAGSALVFSTYLGGSREDNGGMLDPGTRGAAAGIAVDSARNVYVTGTTDSPNFPTRNPLQANNAGLSDIFVAKLAPNGGSLLYGSYLGGSGADYGGDIAANNAGVAFLTGYTLASNFPTKNALQPANAGIPDAIVTRVDTTQSGAASLLSSTYFGGDDTERAFGIAADADGNIYIAGLTESLDLPTKNAFQAANASSGDPIPNDAFVAKLSADGDELLYGSYLGGDGYDVGYGMDIDAGGNIYVAGRTGSDNFPTRGAWQPSRADFTDIFVARVDPSLAGAASLVYSTYLGGTDNDYAYGVAVDRGRNAYVTGFTGPPSLFRFPATSQIGPNGTTTGIIVAKLSPSPTQRLYLPQLQRQ